MGVGLRHNPGCLLLPFAADYRGGVPADVVAARNTRGQGREGSIEGGSSIDFRWQRECERLRML